MLAHVRELGGRLPRGDPVRLHLSGGDRLQHRLRGGEEQIDMAAGDVLQRRRRAAVGNVVDRHLRLLCEQRGRQVPGAAGSGMRHLRRRGPHPGDQLGERIGGERFASDQHQRVVVDEGDRREVLLGIERQVRMQRHIGRDLQIVQQQGMAVRGRARDPAGGDRGGAAADILDDEALPELLGEFRRQHARQRSVGPPAGYGTMMVIARLG